MLKILGSEVPRSTAVLCTDSLVARPRGTMWGLDIGKYRLWACAGWYSVLIGESNVAIDPAIEGYGGCGYISRGVFTSRECFIVNCCYTVVLLTLDV